MKRSIDLRAVVLLTLVLVIVAGLSLSSSTFGSNQHFNVRNQVIEDANNRLFWACDVNMAGSRMNWDDATAYVSALNRQRFAGYTDWRLPDVDELKNLAAAVSVPATGTAKPQSSIVSALEKIGFRNVQPADYWTSSSSLFSETEAWYFSLADGSKGMGSKSLYRYVWPVRWQR